MMKKIEKLLMPSKLITPLGTRRLIDWMPDSIYVRLAYKGEFGVFPNLKNPTSFNEKLQWLKINDHNERYTKLVDKLSAKDIIGKMIGEEYIVPTIGKWDSVDKIDFEKLPSRFVLKCNHDQGSVVIIEDKENIDKDSIKQFLSKKMKRNLYYGTREYPYKNIVPMVFAEEFLGKSIVDYKFYCFNGEPKFLYCGQGLTEDHSLRIDFFDLNWNRMPFYRTDYDRLGNVEKPLYLSEMVEIAKILSKDYPFVRIDLFEVKDRVYFSEFTLCPASGFMPFEPKEYDQIIGEWLVLPKK